MISCHFSVVFVSIHTIDVSDRTLVIIDVDYLPLCRLAEVLSSAGLVTHSMSSIDKKRATIFLAVCLFSALLVKSTGLLHHLRCLTDMWKRLSRG